MTSNLKKVRSDAGVTQAHIAKETGVTYQMVYQWEKGLAPVARKHWKKLAALLKITADELERVLVQTLLDACIATADPRPLANAKTSRQYRQELVADALLRFHAVHPAAPTSTPPAPVQDENAELRREVQFLQLQNRILELEKENAELRREIERLRPAPSSLSGLTDTPKYKPEPEVVK